VKLASKIGIAAAVGALTIGGRRQRVRRRRRLVRHNRERPRARPRRPRARARRPGSGLGSGVRPGPRAQAWARRPARARRWARAGPSSSPAAHLDEVDAQEQLREQLLAGRLTLLHEARDAASTAGRTKVVARPRHQDRHEPGAPRPSSTTASPSSPPPAPPAPARHHPPADRRQDRGRGPWARHVPTPGTRRAPPSSPEGPWARHVPAPGTGPAPTLPAAPPPPRSARGQSRVSFCSQVTSPHLAAAAASSSTVQR